MKRLIYVLILTALPVSMSVGQVIKFGDRIKIDTTIEEKMRSAGIVIDTMPDLYYPETTFTIMGLYADEYWEPEYIKQKHRADSLEIQVQYWFDEYWNQRLRADNLEGIINRPQNQMLVDLIWNKVELETLQDSVTALNKRLDEYMSEPDSNYYNIWRLGLPPTKSRYLAPVSPRLKNFPVDTNYRPRVPREEGRE